MKNLACLTSVLILAACEANAPVETADAPVETVVTEPAPLEFIAPSASDTNYDSPVAPYVMARGAGPSRISPDGQTIATRLSLTGTRQLYVMEADAEDPKSTLKMLSRGSGITFFEFSPTGALIYGADNNGDERENYWLVEPLENSEWSEPRLLLPATEQGFRSFGDFTGDGKTIVYASTERNGLDYDIYTADVATGETRLVFEGKMGNFVEAVAPDGSTAILSETVGEDSDKLFVLDLETGERRVLSDPSPRANHTDAGVEYGSLEDTLILATNRNTEFVSFRLMSLRPDTVFSGGSFYSTDADIDAVRECGRRILVTVNRDGFSDLVKTGRSSQSFEGLPKGVYTFDCADNRLLVRVTAPDIPGDLYRVDLETRDTRRVFASDYDDLDPASLIMPESVRIPARDGIELQGLLYLPRGVTEKPPVIFQVHGGPTAQSRPTYNSSVQYLLSRGFAVFQPNVRGSTGFGRTYVTLDDQRKRLDSVRDLVDMLEWLEADGRVDTDRAAVMGGSYGGYMVNAVLADYPEAFDAGVSLFGVGDWVTALEVASPALKASDLIEYGDISDPDWRAFYEDISPIARADNIRVPVLYSHGVMDPRIDIAETEVMVRALRENGIRADYVRIPDEGHGWRKLSNRLWYEQVQADFLEDVLGR